MDLEMAAAPWSGLSLGLSVLSCSMFVNLLKITSCNHQSHVTEFLGHEIAVAALTHVATGEN